MAADWHDHTELSSNKTIIKGRVFQFGNGDWRFQYAISFNWYIPSLHIYSFYIRMVVDSFVHRASIKSDRKKCMGIAGACCWCLASSSSLLLLLFEKYNEAIATTNLKSWEKKKEIIMWNDRLIDLDWELKAGFFFSSSHLMVAYMGHIHDDLSTFC